MLNAEKLLFSNYNSRNQNKLSPWFSTPMLQSCSLQPEHKHVSHARKSYDSTTLKIASSQHTVTVHTQFLSPRGEFYTEKLRLAGPLLAPRCAWIAALLNIIISLIRQNLFSPLQQHSIQRKIEKNGWWSRILALLLKCFWSCWSTKLWKKPVGVIHG